jgi:hypothetical protein
MPTGMDGGGKLRVLDAGAGVWLVVQSVPAAAYDDASLARDLQSFQSVSGRALAHEAVVERFLSARAVLPMQLFTLFASDERALAYVRRHRGRFHGMFARVERRLEWGLRLTFDARVVPIVPEEPGSARARRRNGANDVDSASPSGARYLARKRDQRNRARLRRLQASAHADELFRVLERHATEAHRRASTPLPDSPMLLDAVFLVPTRQSKTFQAALRREAPDLRAAGIRATLTGPWPPYHFMDPLSVGEPDAVIDSPLTRPSGSVRSGVDTATLSGVSGQPGGRRTPAVGIVPGQGRRPAGTGPSSRAARADRTKRSKAHERRRGHSDET